MNEKLSKVRALMLNQRDDVATLLEPATEQASLSTQSGVCVRVGESIPAFHKIAMRSIEVGEYVVRGGIIIGIATQSIPIGNHVHTHNIRSRRDRK